MGDPLIPASLKPASGWERIASQADADRVGELFGGFHDSLIKELYFAAGAAVDRDGGCTWRSLPHLRVLFHSQWKPAGLEIYFYGVDEVTGLMSPGQELRYGAALRWTSESVTWEGEGTVIRGAIALWRLEPDWLGPRERYLNQDLELEVADPLSLYLYSEGFLRSNVEEHPGCVARRFEHQ